MSGAAFDRTTPATMIDLRYVKKLIEILDESTVDSIEMSSDKGMKIRISKSPSQRGAVAMQAPMAMPQMMAPQPHPPAPSPAAPAAGAPGPAAETPRAAADKLLEVKSPMVGTFYASPEPGAKPYVSVGQRVEKGQILCIIEAMKIMNEIECEFSGVVRELSAQDSQPVEYGQVLFRIDPNG